MTIVWEWRGHMRGKISGVYVDIEALVSIADGDFIDRTRDVLVVVPTSPTGHRSATSAERELALETSLGAAVDQLVAAKSGVT